VRTKQPHTSIKSAQKHGRIKSSKTVVTPVKASSGSVVDILVTFNSKKNKYKRILNKNDKEDKNKYVNYSVSDSEDIDYNFYN
ncbi:4536_t:CDS:2, partial [Scutellospora calospora]